MSKKQERLASLKGQVERVQRRMDVLGQRSRQFWLVKLIALFYSVTLPQQSR
ncbi:hypothetical protein ccbrp13_41660 [Ktedonobacteria bacterium brp13]|nr:hypothetical protein ccbrp13_41660 [Ktedonobacteria bacterium brp13]